MGIGEKVKRSHGQKRGGRGKGGRGIVLAVILLDPAKKGEKTKGDVDLIVKTDKRGLVF